MKTLKSHKSLLATAIGAALAVGIASQAYASPVFTVTPPGPFTTTPFVADFINGASSELLTGNAAIGSGAGTLTATTGWLNFTGFSNGGSPVLPGTSGLGIDYQLYLTFNLTANYSGGGAGFGTAGSNYNLGSLHFDAFLSPLAGGADTFTQANATTHTQATVTDVGANDVLLGSGDLVSGVAGFDAQFGAFLNSITSYANTAAGTAFFTAPNPFYDLAFNAFNNTIQGVILNTSTNGCTATAPCISVTNAIGGVDFNRVPEPETLALLGIGLLGIGASLRKRKAV